MSWKSFFPFPECRPAQAEGLEFIFTSLSQADDIFLEAPTGIGKSAMAIALARRLAAVTGSSTYISTSTIVLEDQYIKDFTKLGLRQLHAKSHYLCPSCRTCDVGSHEIKTTFGKRKLCAKGDDCSYRTAKAAFHEAYFSIANAAYLCTCARHTFDWASREIAIFDEAHLLHDTISSGYSFDIHSGEVEFFPAEDGAHPWLKDQYSFWLTTRITDLQYEFDHTSENDPDIQRICRKLERAEQKQTTLQLILQDNPENWIFDQQDDRLSISPLWASSLAAGLLPRIGQKRIYLSATLPGFVHQARYLGIDPQKARFLALGSPFPVEHRLIHICPVVKWDYRNTGPALAQTARALERILAMHPDDRGLVHVSSYFQAREIVQQVRLPFRRRLVTHENAEEKDVRLEEMFAKPGTVLVSPSSHEGLDLYGDRSRFQIIAKLPFASLGDKRVKKRMEVDKNWYNLATAQKFIQACGRSIRSDTDYATTYVLDAAFDGFYNRAHQFFPLYLLDALRIKEVEV